MDAFSEIPKCMCMCVCLYLHTYVCICGYHVDMMHIYVLITKYGST